MVKKYTFILFLFVNFNLLAQSIDFEVDKREVRVGESMQITISYNINGTLDIQTPDQFEFGGFTSSQSSTSWINGQRKVNQIYQKNGYFFEPGTYTLGPAIIVKGNKEFKSKTIEIVVIGNKEEPKKNPTEQSSDQNLKKSLSNKNFVGLIDCNKNTVYVGEPLQTQGKVMSAMDFELYAYSRQYTIKGNVESHTVGSLEEVDKKIIENYGQALLSAGFDKKVYFFNEPGNYKVSPFEINANYGGFYAQKVISESKNITVKPLPKKQPKDYLGVVGTLTLNDDFKALKPEMGKTYKLRISLEGNGNIHRAAMPKLEFSEGWEQASEPGFSSKYIFDELGANGKLEYEYHIKCVDSVPSSLGPITLSYFDPEKEEFVQLKSKYIFIQEDSKDSYSKEEDKQSSPVLSKTDNENNIDNNQDLNTKQSQVDSESDLFKSPILWITIGIGSALLFLLAYVLRPQWFSFKKGDTTNSTPSKREINQWYKDAKQSFLNQDFAIAVSKMEKSVFCAICLRLGENYIETEQFSILKKLEQNPKYNPIFSEVKEFVEAAQQYRYGILLDDQIPNRLMKHSEKILSFLKLV